MKHLTTNRLAKNNILFFKSQSLNPIKCSTALKHMKIIYGLLLLTAFSFLSLTAKSQVPIPNEAEWTGGGYALKKIVSNTSIPSGVNFSYTILFSAPAGATNIQIQDQIPTSLVVVSVPTPANVNGVTPAVTITGTPGVNEVVNYSLSGLPGGSASSGSFTIVVKFPEGVTCEGASARNRAGIFTDDWHYTPFVSTTASADDPWRVSKSILEGAVVNPSGGSCGYMIAPDATVKYRLYVMKNSPYWGNVSGQMNMSGAVVTDVLPAGAVVVSSTCSGISVGASGVLNWNVNSGGGGLLDAANPYAYYYCEIEVHYPVASFPTGSFIYNDLTLDGTICNQPVSHTSNQTCVEVVDYTPNPNANFHKYISLANRVPGCTGIYQIVFCNNGNVALSAFNITDVIPSGINVDKINIYNANATTTVDLNVNGSTYASGISSTYTSGTITSPTVNSIQLQMTGSLPVGDCIYMYVYFTIEPNPTGTVVTNCASFDGLANGLTLSDACVSFTVEEGAPKPCLIKDICSPLASYEPGDIIRYRIRVQNIGSADISGATFQDILHSNFTYVGNEEYYVASNYNPPCSVGGGIPAGTTAWTGVNPAHSGNNLSWVLPDIPSDCQLFYSSYCGTYGTSALPYYFIEFDVMVDSLALPGVTPNSYDISGGNLSTAVTSNTVDVLVVASFGQEVEKQVSIDGGTSFTSSGAVSPGGTARYRLNYKNTSNVPVSNVNLVDLLPLNDAPSDWLILDRSTARGSSFGVVYASNHTTTLVPGGAGPASVLNYSNVLNACLPIFSYSPGGCVGPGWGTTPPGQNIKVDYSTYNLPPNVKIQENFDVSIPANAQVQQMACNDFAAISTAGFLLDGVPQSITLTPIAAPPVCITVDTLHQSSCCDSIRIEQTFGAAGEQECCVRITTECEVKSIDLSVDNGTINSAVWNCGTVPTGYQGQSNFTFAANGCAIDMTNCFTPDQPGSTTVYYTINFQNGEVCRDSMVLDCKVADVNCCDSISLVAYQDADLEECCVRLTTKCEMDSILVTVNNGVFSSNSWNCSVPLPAAAIGQSSYMFDAASCVLNMTNCFTASQAGVISVNYVFFFANGEKCEKSIELECKFVEANCCDSISLVAYQDADLEECCVRLTTKCEMDSILVTVNNGVFSSNSWNCSAPIPAAAIGQSSYMFDAASCVLNMTNCFTASQAGVISVNYVFFFANGEKCEKSIELECKFVEENCCDSLMLEPVQGDDGCCIRLKTKCEVESIEVSATNGVISSASWNCGTILSDAIGVSNYTFTTNPCAADLVTCFNASQGGVISVNYVVTFANGEKCEKSIEIDCPLDNDPCCAEVELKLKPKWPWWNNLNGMFTITNADPSVPICYVEMAYSPATTMTTGNLYVDGVLSTQSWNQTRIPAVGNLSPSAVNTIKFNMVSSNYKGVVTVCVVKCDGTRCCFEFNWNKKPWGHAEIPIEEYSPTGKLVGISISPVLDIQEDVDVKYVSFGFVDETEINEAKKEFFAVSGSTFGDEEIPAGLANTASAYMGKHSAFFELNEPVDVKANLGIFNMVFSNGLPKLGCTLFDTEGNLIAGGQIEVSEIDTLATAVIDVKSAGAGLFDFVNLYPNPSQGEFTITYVTGQSMEIEILVVNPLGQLIKIQKEGTVVAGVHNTTIDVRGLPAGMYKTVLKAGDQLLSKSTLIK